MAVGTVWQSKSPCMSWDNTCAWSHWRSHCWWCGCRGWPSRTCRSTPAPPHCSAWSPSPGTPGRSRPDGEPGSSCWPSALPAGFPWSEMTELSGENVKTTRNLYTRVSTARLLPDSVWSQLCSLLCSVNLSIISKHHCSPDLPLSEWNAIKFYCWLGFPTYSHCIVITRKFCHRSSYRKLEKYWIRPSTNVVKNDNMVIYHYSRLKEKHGEGEKVIIDEVV